MLHPDVIRRPACHALDLLALARAVGELTPEQWRDLARVLSDYFAAGPATAEVRTVLAIADSLAALTKEDNDTH